MFSSHSPARVWLVLEVAPAASGGAALREGSAARLGTRLKGWVTASLHLALSPHHLALKVCLQLRGGGEGEGEEINHANIYSVDLPSPW